MSVPVSQPLRPPFSPGRPDSYDPDDPFGDPPSEDGPFDEEEGADDPEAEPLAAGGREGLPPDFRMRHDAHYVEHVIRPGTTPPIRHLRPDEIDGGRHVPRVGLERLVASITRFGVLQPLLVRRRQDGFELVAGSRRLAAARVAGLPTVPCLVYDVNDGRARELATADNLYEVRERPPGDRPADPQISALGAGLFAESANTLATCLGLLAEQGRPLREQVAVSLMRSEARRTAWLARAYAVLAGSAVVDRSEVMPDSLLDDAAEAVRSDPRLSGVSLVRVSSNGASPASADQGLVALGVTGLLIGVALAARSGGVATPVVEAQVRTADGLLWLDLVERRSRVDASALSETLAVRTAMWPGGPEAAVGIAAARRVAILHGGRISASPAEPNGFRLSLGLPLMS